MNNDKTDDMTWQPIETAPKDGTEVDLWVVGEHRFGNMVYKGGYRISNVHWCWCIPSMPEIEGWVFCGDVGQSYMPNDMEDGYYLNKATPTHWRPVPKPPEGMMPCIKSTIKPKIP